MTEAGGVVSDSYGAPLDFGKGRTLGENRGIVACGKGIHETLIAAIKTARQGVGESESGSGKL